MPVTPSPHPPFGVLVLPGGTEIGLEVRRSLADLKEITLAGAGAPADRHGPFAYRRWATVPSVTEPGWQAELNAAIERFAIDFVFPGHDDALLALAEHADAIAARVVTSPVATCRLTRSKRATYAALAAVVPVPRVYEDATAVDAFPVFVKPDAAQGSQGAMLVRDAGALERAVAGGSDLIMEYLPGEELTVDCFSDRERGLLFARARPRVRTRAGISMSSHTVADDPVIRELAEAIDGRLDLHGAWFFQLREDASGRLRLLEVAPRAAGTSAVHRVTGVNFALLSIYEQLRVPVAIAANAGSVELDRALANRYRHDLRYGTVYVDLDDTLVVRDAVNTSLVAFLYQCLNAGHRLVLLTRHRGDLEQTLSRFRLHGLWDQVVRVGDAEAKADYIAEADAILIDDSFRERAEAHDRRGIATFDASMLELLLDDRA
ncbi:MAG TPA: ATP-grasp domain-containing protein [Solirubrobacteraceae bacterium]